MGHFHPLSIEDQREHMEDKYVENQQINLEGSALK